MIVSGTLSHTFLTCLRMSAFHTSALHLHVMLFSRCSIFKVRGKLSVVLMDIQFSLEDVNLPG